MQMRLYKAKVIPPTAYTPSPSWCLHNAGTHTCGACDQKPTMTARTPLETPVCPAPSHAGDAVVGRQQHAMVFKRNWYQ